MEINITGQNIEITPTLKSYVEEKFDKLIKIAEDATQMHIILKVDKLDRHLQSAAEANVHLPGSDIIHAEATSEDMYHSIILLVEKLIRQVEKFKAKRSG